MSRNAYVLVFVITLIMGAACLCFAPVRADTSAAPVFDVELPSGYRDWRLISVAHEAGNLNDLRAVLGNDIAIKAYRDRKLPFPDGAIIARLAWKYTPSEENNKVFGREQSFVTGDPTNVQFMVKDAKKYAATVAGGSLNSTTVRQWKRQAFPVVMTVTCRQRPRLSVYSICSLIECFESRRPRCKSLESHRQS